MNKQLGEDSANDRSASSARTLQVILCNPLARSGLGYPIGELLDNMPGPLLRPLFWYTQGDPTLAREYHRPVFSQLLWRALWKARIPAAWQGRAVVEVALRKIRSGDLVYVWPPYSTSLMRRAKDRGAILVAERINCMAAMCTVILERAYARSGLPVPSVWSTPESIEEERIQMALCDFVTAPGDFVVQSLLDSGIPRDRILKTTYGWSPARLASVIDSERPDRPPVFAFVAQGIVRKGLNLLLEAWEKADVKGKLLITGQVHDEIHGVCSRQLARPDVQQLGWVPDLAGVYAAADIFVLPSHEEGSPLVAYDAAACGLASIVSPMGAVPVVRDGNEGYIIDPYDIDAWVEAIRTLAQDVALRRSFGASAAVRAKEFTWQRVAGRRYEQLVEATTGSRR